MAKSDNESKSRSLMVELSILRLAALAVETRRALRRSEIRRVPSLSSAFTALDSVMTELGWGVPNGLSHE